MSNLNFSPTDFGKILNKVSWNSIQCEPSCSMGTGEQAWPS